jgi:DNA-binding NtrC family response regulator
VESEGVLTPDEFRELSVLAALLIPHDEATLTLWPRGKRHRSIFLSTQGADPKVEEPGPPGEMDGVRLITEDESRARGAGSGVRVPLRITDEVGGYLILYAQRRGAYSDEVLPKTKTLADYICAVLSREHSVSRMFEDLINTLANVLDPREVFPRVSENVAAVLPHDRLALAFDEDQGYLNFQAATSDAAIPLEQRRLKVSDLHESVAAGFKLIGDLATEYLPVVEPADFQTQMLAAGYRSVLAAHTSTRHRSFALHFWSKRPHAYSLRDLPVARRVADCVGLALSHQQIAEAERKIAEERARAERLELRVRSLVEQLDAKSGYTRVIGQSKEWKAVLKRAAQVAATDTTVLLTGESGTGKEVIARLIHRASARKDAPLLAVNCAALPEQLLESELFGYERGAFTSALQSKPGQIELAAGGILFLDEVSEMVPSAQAKLLRVLQEREFRRVGGTRVLKADIRVMAATNRNLKQAMERGDFRQDLYYRLSVFDISLPPLRSRPDDLLLLAEAFLDELAKSFGGPPVGMTRRAKEALLAYPWPGNVRELRNVLERAAILSEGALIDLDHLALDMSPAVSNPNVACTDLNVVERETIGLVMRECKGNKSLAAKRLGLTRTQLYVRLHKHGIAAAGN